MHQNDNLVQTWLNFIKKTPHISLKNSHEKNIESEVKYKRNRLPTGDTACEFQNTRFFLPNLLIDTCKDFVSVIFQYPSQKCGN